MTFSFFTRKWVPVAMWALAAPACAAKTPAWVNGRDAAFPEGKYVIGVGVGGDLDGARANARAEISRIFQARVQQTLLDVQTEQSASVGRRRGPAAGTQKSELNTVLTTESLLEGAIIKTTWFDKRAKKYYALAVLDKGASQRALSGQITDLEETIAGRRAEARKAETPMARARALSQARAAGVERDALAARRRVVDPAGMAVLPGDSTAAIDTDLNAALNELRIVLDAVGPKDSRLKEKMAEKVTGLGFGVREGAAGGLTLKATLKVDPFDRGHAQWKFYSWSGTVQLVDADGKVLAGATPSGQEGQLIDDSARAKATDAGDEAVAQEAGKILSQYVLGQ